MTRFLDSLCCVQSGSHTGCGPERGGVGGGGLWGLHTPSEVRHIQEVGQVGAIWAQRRRGALAD